jgi:hypothetical protein
VEGHEIDAIVRVVHHKVLALITRPGVWAARVDGRARAAARVKAFRAHRQQLAGRHLFHRGRDGRDPVCDRAAAPVTARLIHEVPRKNGGIILVRNARDAVDPARDGGRVPQEQVPARGVSIEIVVLSC